MSTRIYNAYQTDASFSDVVSALRAHRVRVLRRARKALEVAGREAMHHEFHKATMDAKGSGSRKDIFGKMIGVELPASRLVEDMNHRLAGSRVLTQDVVLYAIPRVKGEALGNIAIQVFGDRDTRSPMDISQFLRKVKAEDFHYQNATDRPDGVTPREWKAREKAWDAILSGPWESADTPAQAGFSYPILTPFASLRSLLTGMCQEATLIAADLGFPIRKNQTGARDDLTYLVAQGFAEAYKDFIRTREAVQGVWNKFCRGLLRVTGVELVATEYTHPGQSAFTPTPEEIAAQKGRWVPKPSFQDEPTAPKKPVLRQHTGTRYVREIPTLNELPEGVIALVDVYCVLEAFEIRCPAAAHELKKRLCAGIRGKNDVEQDLKEADDAGVRARELSSWRKAKAARDSAAIKFAEVHGHARHS